VHMYCSIRPKRRYLHVLFVFLGSVFFVGFFFPVSKVSWLLKCTVRFTCALSLAQGAGSENIDRVLAFLKVRHLCIFPEKAARDSSGGSLYGYVYIDIYI